MTPDLSYYWEGAREKRENKNWDEQRTIVAKVPWYMITTHSIPIPLFGILYFYLSTLLYAKIVYRLLFFGAVVHPERRY